MKEETTKKYGIKKEQNPKKGRKGRIACKETKNILNKKAMWIIKYLVRKREKSNNIGIK